MHLPRHFVIRSVRADIGSAVCRRETMHISDEADFGSECAMATRPCGESATGPRNGHAAARVRRRARVITRGSDKGSKLVPNFHTLMWPWDVL